MLESLVTKRAMATYNLYFMGVNLSLVLVKPHEGNWGLDEDEGVDSGGFASSTSGGGGAGNTPKHWAIVANTTSSTSGTDFECKLHDFSERIRSQGSWGLP
jgi:hypothetical protein